MLLRNARAQTRVFAMVTPLVVAAACGGRAVQAGAPTASKPDAGPPVAAADSGRGAPLPFSTATVPMAAMPAPFQFGSKKADRKLVAGSEACVTGFRAAGDLAGEVQKLAKACSDKVKSRPLAAPWTGSQAQGAPAQSYKLKAEAGRCYRVYAVAAPSVTSLTVMVVDSAGAVAREARADEPRVALPDNGLLCFKSADDAAITVSVGGGEGAYAVQVWTDP